MHYVYLAMAILAEVIGTNALKATEGFTRLMPSAVVVIGYAASFYFLSMVLKSMSIGVVYAIWAGLGIVLIAVSGAIFFGQKIDLPGMIGMAMIVAGVVIIHLFSKTAVH